MKITFLTPYDIKSVDIKYFFLFDINNEDIVISKLVSQLKLLPSLIELKDNNTIILSTINKKLPEM